jgi:hypothetical protein
MQADPARPKVSAVGRLTHLECLDRRMRMLQILVESVPLGNELCVSSIIAEEISTYMLLPLPESRLFQLDLLGESLSQHLLFFLVFWVVNLSDFWFSEFTRLHLGETVCLVVILLSRSDEVEHIGANEQPSKLFEIAVIFVFDWNQCSSAMLGLL